MRKKQEESSPTIEKMIIEWFEGKVKQMLLTYPIEKGDYLTLDGTLMCGKCHTPKRKILKHMTNTKNPSTMEKTFYNRLIPLLCECEKKKQR